MAIAETRESAMSLEAKIEALGGPLAVLRAPRAGVLPFPVRAEFTNWRDEQESWRKEGEVGETETVTLSGAPVAALLDDYSLEMTGKDLGELESARALIPAGTQINVTFLANEDLEMRVAAAGAVRASGFVAVPHVSARRLGSAGDLREFLSALRDADASQSLFTVGGDPERPLGPYADALALIRSGLLEQYGGQRISIAGYPEGHPVIEDGVLWTALRDKAAALIELGMDGDIVTQFGFDLEPILAWVEAVRELGIEMPVRIGVPGPAGVKRLVAYARRFGVGLGSGIARKYGLSLTNLMSTAGPDRFLSALHEAYEPQRHGELRVHFYTFGGLRATSEWVADFKAKL
jgi:methylenetetrahydrofolate reductase (NADPH)